MPGRRLSTTVFLTALTLAAFAGNSLLCRAALAGGTMDPLAFTGVRLVSGAVVLAPFLLLRTEPASARTPWGVAGAAALVVYAVAFSLAYVLLDAGLGALLLFGAVQVTMIGAGIDAGERPSARQVVGVVAALSGLAWLVAPGVAAPEPTAAGLMVLAGVSWGGYSLIGRRAGDPIRATARNFALAAVPGIGLFLVGRGRVDADGLALAALSGAVTSGLGYVVWYAALRGLTHTVAAVVQLLVPVLAAVGGVLLLGESATPRLAAAGALTLGGVAVAVVAPRRA